MNISAEKNVLLFAGLGRAPEQYSQSIQGDRGIVDLLRRSEIGVMNFESELKPPQHTSSVSMPETLLVFNEMQLTPEKQPDFWLRANLLVFIIDFESMEMGARLAEAQEYGYRILFLRHSVNAARPLPSMLTPKECEAVRTYSTVQDVVRHVNDTIESHAKK
ncbi:MAG: hypothetical protein RL094_115 [Candidatus Parcubacteria bacterium]|jgi:hypothetical protein